MRTLRALGALFVTALLLFSVACETRISGNLVNAPENPGDPNDPNNPPTPDARFQAFLKVWGALNPAVGQRQRCAACHSGGGPGRPDHAQDDSRRAYDAARTVINPRAPRESRLYQQATSHQPSIGVVQFNQTELVDLERWIEMEATPIGPIKPPPPELEGRQPQYALALSSVALRVAQVPAHVAELMAIDEAADPDAQRALYEQLVDTYLSHSASEVDLPFGNGDRRPGVYDNVFFNPELAPGYPNDPPADEPSDGFALTSIDFDRAAGRGRFLVYPSALSRLALQWIGFGGIRSSRNSDYILNQDNFGAMDALMRTIIDDRPIRDAFSTYYTGKDGATHQTRACLFVPFSGYETPQMYRQVCRQNAEVDEPAPSGAPVPGGLLGSRALHRVEYGHYKFHTLRTMFRSFHCKDFPVFTSNKVSGNDDSAARALVTSPWNETGTTPYCASCHAASGMNLMALALWRFDDSSGVLHDGYRAVRPTETRASPSDIVTSAVDTSKFYYKDQVLDSLEDWFAAFVADDDFIRCNAAQIYNFAMGRGPAWQREHLVPQEKVDELLARYESIHGAGSSRDMTVLKMLAVVFKSTDFTHR